MKPSFSLQEWMITVVSLLGWCLIHRLYMMVLFYSSVTLIIETILSFLGIFRVCVLT